MHSIFTKILTWLFGSKIPSVIKGMGFATVSFAIMNTLIVTMLNQVSNRMSGITGYGANFMGLSGMDHGLAMIAGAIVTAVYIKSAGISLTRKPKSSGGGDGEFEA